MKKAICIVLTLLCLIAMTASGVGCKSPSEQEQESRWCRYEIYVLEGAYGPGKIWALEAASKKLYASDIIHENMPSAQAVLPPLSEYKTYYLKYYFYRGDKSLACDIEKVTLVDDGSINVYYLGKAALASEATYGTREYVFKWGKARYLLSIKIDWSLEPYYR